MVCGVYSTSTYKNGPGLLVLTHSWEAGKWIVGEGYGPLVVQKRRWRRSGDVEDRSRRHLGVGRRSRVLAQALRSWVWLSGGVRCTTGGPKVSRPVQLRPSRWGSVRGRHGNLEKRTAVHSHHGSSVQLVCKSRRYTKAIEERTQNHR